MQFYSPANFSDISFCHCHLWRWNLFSKWQIVILRY